METVKRGPHPLAAHLAASWEAALKLPDPHGAMKRFHEGLTRYQNHPWQRANWEPVVLHRLGSARLLDYGPLDSAPLLVVPSLINPAWVLDLDEESSLLRWLSAQGYRPLLVDWGEPGTEERGFTLDDYVTRRLLPILDRLGGPLPVLGYCLGGTLSVALAALAPSRVSKLALMAAPWDMRGYAPDQRERLAGLAQDWSLRSAALGAVPMELVQLLFLGLDPALTLAKFLRFADMDPTGSAARAFIALEDWANSGPPLALPAAQQLLCNWYGCGGPATGWTIGDQKIEPPEQPTLVVIAGTDRIVPEAVSRPLADSAPEAIAHIVEAGHVGMVVGSRRKALLWEPLRDFLDT
jgi:polyhydroxyalkanoate synthase subunit PhaC